MKRHTRRRMLFTLAFCAVLLSLAACVGPEEPDTALQKSKADGSASPGGTPAEKSAAGGDISKLGGEIEQLEKLAERNPGDDEARDELSSAYVRRANALRAAQRMKEALDDYQRALRINPDNEEAQKYAAEIAPAVEGTPQEGEYGEPPPLPITPNVTGGEEKASPTPTPKRP
ncbi:MAG: tetratricopeptide repeat protein [Acidobacteria bacterium]|nr:tetratricopeptide repeat protein [Acidobacteriota bacterium]